MWKGVGVNLECVYCGKSFHVKLYRKDTAKYCSYECKRANWINVVKGRKEGHWNWKGGITKEDKIERFRFNFQVQKRVLERDNYTCQMCGIRGISMQVDHIQPWSEYPLLRFNIDNCRTLCMKCHYQITFGRPTSETVKNWGNYKTEKKEG